MNVGVSGSKGAIKTRLTSRKTLFSVYRTIPYTDFTFNLTNRILVGLTVPMRVLFS